jgi:hypothetical protein
MMVVKLTIVFNRGSDSEVADFEPGNYVVYTFADTIPGLFHKLEHSLAEGTAKLMEDRYGSPKKPSESGKKGATKRFSS